MTPGSEMIAEVTRLREAGWDITTETSGHAQAFSVTCPAWRLRLTVDASRWLGLQFSLLGAGGKEDLYHEIDTDLYDISSQKYAEFAGDIETDIVTFVRAVTSDRAKVRRSTKSVALIVPTTDGFDRVQKGRFLTSSTHFVDEASAMQGEAFAPLTRDG